MHAIFGALPNSADAQFSTKPYDETLPYPGWLFGPPWTGPGAYGWIFLDGVTDVTISDYGDGVAGAAGLFGNYPFTLSNFEIAVGGSPVPEPAAWKLIAGAAPLLFAYLRRKKNL